MQTPKSDRKIHLFVLRVRLVEVNLRWFTYSLTVTCIVGSPFLWNFLVDSKPPSTYNTFTSILSEQFCLFFADGKR